MMKKFNFLSKNGLNITHSENHLILENAILLMKRKNLMKMKIIKINQNQSLIQILQKMRVSHNLIKVTNLKSSNIPFLHYKLISINLIVILSLIILNCLIIQKLPNQKEIAFPLQLILNK